MNEWFHIVKHSDWESFADVRSTYNATDKVEHLTVFDVGGNKFRIITAIDYVHGIIYIRNVLHHRDYLKGQWKNDQFGKKGWKATEKPPAVAGRVNQKNRKRG
jgi:mRNA interferase HigB